MEISAEDGCQRYYNALREIYVKLSQNELN